MKVSPWKEFAIPQSPLFVKPVTDPRCPAIISVHLGKPNSRLIRHYELHEYAEFSSCFQGE